VNGVAVALSADTPAGDALNRGVLHLFHELRPEGFTFRLIHPGWMRTYMSGTRNDEATFDPLTIATAVHAACLEPAMDEDVLVMHDWEGNPWPW
jgi:hypothetical protein